MEIILGLISALFWPAVVILIIVWLVKKLSNTSPTEYKVVDTSSTHYGPSENEIRAKVAEEIRAQARQYKTSSQKQVVEDMAQTVEYFMTHGYMEQDESTPTVAAVTEMSSPIPQPSMASAVKQASFTVDEPYETPWKKLSSLDGATILLYLGAFLLLASIGLYVGFGSGTTIKALLVSLLTILFYGAGIALYKNSTRLKPAGLTFAAIGMATLPIAGAAIYYYALAQTHAPAVWLSTSLLALVMYVHAMYVLRSSLVSYMVVFSSISIVLSGISSIGLAPYYFIQGLGVCGILFALIARYLSKNDTGLSDAYEQSSVFLVPFSVAMSVLFIAQVGWLQLALSLLLGAAYYTYMAVLSSGTKPVYVLLTQMMIIPSSISAIYGVSESGSAVRVLLCIIVATYILVWLSWARLRARGDAYRRQVKGFLLGLPLVAVGAFTVSIHALWVAVAVMLVASVVVYASDRDALSGLEWLSALVILPALYGFLSADPRWTVSQVGIVYLVLTSIAVCVRVLARSAMTQTDTYLQRTLVWVSLITASLLQVGSNDKLQLLVAISSIALLCLQAWFESSSGSWFGLSSLVQLVWLLAFIDNAKLFTGMLAGVIVYNLALVQLKSTSGLHSWLASMSVLALPFSYGLWATQPRWGAREFLITYGFIAVVFLTLRYLKYLVNAQSATFTYVVSVSIALGYAYSLGSKVGLIVAFAVTGLLLVAEWVEKEDLFGWLAPLIPLTLLLDQRASSRLQLLMIGLVTLLAFATTALRRRKYESYLVAVGVVVLPWLAGTVVYEWRTQSVMAVYLIICAALIGVRQLSKRSAESDIYKGALQLTYVSTLSLAIIYGTLSSWTVMAISYFVAGLLTVAISYIEDAPSVIILSFGLGYISILRYTTGLDLSLNATVGILLALTQGTYWALIVSKLQTVRASYARSFQLCVAIAIPLIGISSPLRSIYPFALALFGAMFAREVWVKSQGYRETSLLIVHGSLLWWLYTLGIREFQVYSQSTAAVVGLFAFWRRKRQDIPQIINQYLWLAVLIFSVPMVWQAISTGNTMYSYLVLVEHVVLIVISIAFKRATFAWWGIAVVVASVLYQLRKLRYAALAFLGVFIISLAVYFLLRYNKPELSKK